MITFYFSLSLSFTHTLSLSLYFSLSLSLNALSNLGKTWSLRLLYPHSDLYLIIHIASLSYPLTYIFLSFRPFMPFTFLFTSLLLRIIFFSLLLSYIHSIITHQNVFSHFHFLYPFTALFFFLISYSPPFLCPSFLPSFLPSFVPSISLPTLHLLSLSSSSRLVLAAHSTLLILSLYSSQRHLSRRLLEG